MEEIQKLLEDMLDVVPDIEAVILLDVDGIPLALAGTFYLQPDELGAMLAAAYQSYNIIGQDMGQNDIEQITVNYEDLKLLQFGMTRSSLTIIVVADASLAVIRLEAKRAISQIKKLMASTDDVREQMMQNLKIERSD